MISPDAAVLALLGTIGSLLLAGNVFFIKRLIDKVERSGVAEVELKGAVEKLGKDVNALGASLRDFKSEIKSELKEFRRLEIDLGIIKAQIGTNPKGKDA